MPGKIIDKPNCTVFIPMFETQYTTDISVLVFYPGNTLNTTEARDVFVKPLKEAMLKIRDKYVIVVANTSSSKWDTVKKEYTDAMAGTPMGDGKDPNYVLKEKTISISVFGSSGSGTADIQTSLVSINPLHLLIMNTVSGTLIQNVKTLISKGTSCYLMYDLEFFNSMPDLKALMPSLVAAVDAGGAESKSIKSPYTDLVKNSVDFFGPMMEKKLITPTQKKQDQPVNTEKDKKSDEEAAKDANQAAEKKQSTDAKWNITINGLGDSAGPAATAYEIGAKSDMPSFIIYVGNPEIDWVNFGENVPEGGDDFQNVGDEEGLDEEFTEQGFAGDEEETNYQLGEGAIYGDSEGSEDSTGGGADDTATATGSLPPSSNSGGTGKKRFQLSMMVNGVKVLNGELPKNLVKKVLGFELEVHAANKLAALNVKFKEQFGTNIQMSGGNRSFNTQNDIFDWDYFDQYSKGRKKPGSDGKPKRGTVAAAKPGTSKHGWALAIDTSFMGDKGSPKYDWMDANAPKYGWVNPAWAKKGGAGHEPWHWEYIGADAYKNDGAK
jgi:LAS superfamily LD-carboxypeptidase LdcB